jgi:hypothetical protein
MPETIEKFTDFHYCTITLDGYSSEELSQKKMLRAVFQEWRSIKAKSENFIFDRHKGWKAGTPKRRLLITSDRLSKKGKRCYGKIALINEKAPQFWSKTDNIVEEIEKEKNREFIQSSNFVIDFESGDYPICMFEYNHIGPRIPDFIWYLRQLIKLPVKVASGIKHALHTNTDIIGLEKSIRNVFRLDVQIQHSNLAALKDNDFKIISALKSISSESPFQDVQLNLNFGMVKNKNTSEYKRNIRALDLVRPMLHWFNQDEKNIDKLDSFKVRYQVDNDTEVYLLEFIDNKTTSRLNLESDSGATKDAQYTMEVMGEEFSSYLKTKKTNYQPVV